ncbi:DUF4240 domain-containing protein [Streptomyces sp. NPDC087859]|uniref:DUF4240 domain-containing protein n=1 Tax=Streptomyces sp. NPDC087859 TaxID=3365812 RepID=UPI0037F588B7
MTEDEFWTLIEGARQASDGVLEEQARLLRAHLAAGTVAGLLEFRDCWDEIEERVFTWPIWDASCVLLGFVSDDFFSDVRAWIMSHGRDAVNHIATDPDALATLADDRRSVESGAAEELSMLVWGVWEDLTGDCGGEFPPSPIQGEGPTGDRIDLMDCEAVRERFPRLVELGGRSGVQT